MKALLAEFSVQTSRTTTLVWVSLGSILAEKVGFESLLSVQSDGILSWDPDPASLYWPCLGNIHLTLIFTEKIHSSSVRCFQNKNRIFDLLFRSWSRERQTYDFQPFRVHSLRSRPGFGLVLPVKPAGSSLSGTFLLWLAVPRSSLLGFFLTWQLKSKQKINASRCVRGMCSTS